MCACVCHHVIYRRSSCLLIFLVLYLRTMRSPLKHQRFSLALAPTTCTFCWRWWRSVEGETTIRMWLVLIEYCDLNIMTVCCCAAVWYAPFKVSHSGGGVRFSCDGAREIARNCTNFLCKCISSLSVCVSVYDCVVCTQQQHHHHVCTYMNA